MPTPPTEQGWKDVVLVMPNDSVKFITRFETFANDTVPYMFHCHLLHHEDDGMMGSFLVIDTTGTAAITQIQKQTFKLYPNPVSENLFIQFNNEISFAEINLFNVLGKNILKQNINNHNSITLNVTDLFNGVYFIQVKSLQESTTLKIIVAK